MNIQVSARMKRLLGGPGRVGGAGGEDEFRNRDRDRECKQYYYDNYHSVIGHSGTSYNGHS